MIASRRKPSATPSAAKEPGPSGPRWSSSAAMRSTVAASGGLLGPTIPQIPHMVAHDRSRGFGNREAGCVRESKNSHFRHAVRHRPPFYSPGVKDQGANIVPESVEELRNAVRDLVKDEDARAQSLNGRASGLTGFVGLILSVAAAAGAVGGRGTAAGLHHWPRIVVGVSVAAALLALVAAVFASVVKVLLPSPGVTISIKEVERYPFPEFISQDKVMIQGRLMWGFVDALKRERQPTESKPR